MTTESSVVYVLDVRVDLILLAFRRAVRLWLFTEKWFIQLETK